MFYFLVVVFASFRSYRVKDSNTCTVLTGGECEKKNIAPAVICTGRQIEPVLSQLFGQERTGRRQVHMVLLQVQHLNGVINRLNCHRVRFLTYTNLNHKYQKIDATSLTIAEFLSKFKKGSRNFRNVMSYGSTVIKVSGSRPCKTFARLIDCPVPVEIRAAAMYTSWSSHFLNTSIRVFLFKFYNNILGINTRVANFNPNINAGCTFCGINGPFPVPAETFTHLFFDCNHVQNILGRLYDKYLCNFDLNKNSFFITNINEKECENWPVMIFFNIVRYNIWQNKLEKKIPVFYKICVEIEYAFEIIFGTSPKVFDMFNNCNYFQKIRDGEHMGRRSNWHP